MLPILENDVLGGVVSENRKDFRPLFTWRSAICDSGLPATTRHVALTLSLHMNERGGSCFPGAVALAAETGLSERAVRSHLNELVRAGWIRITEHGGLKGGHRRANAYEATTPAPPAPIRRIMGDPDDSTPAPDDADPCTPCTPGRHEGDIEGVPIALARETTEVAVVGRRDLLFESVAEVCGIDWHHLTGRSRQALNAAVKDIRPEWDGTPDQVRAKANEYRVRMPRVELTPNALAKWWPSCNGDTRFTPGGKGAIARAVTNALEADRG